MKNLTLITQIWMAVAVIISATGCKQKQSSEKPKTVVTAARNVYLLVDTGKIQRESFKDIHLYYIDSFARGHMPSLTGAEIKLPLKAPTMLISADAKQTLFVVYPGERVHLRYTHTDSLQLFIPGNEQRNHELDFFRQLILKTGSLYYLFTVMPYHKKVANLEALHAHESAINNAKNNRLQFLKAYVSQYKMSGGFAKLAAHGIKSTAINDSLILYNNNRFWLIKQGIYQKLAEAKIPSLNTLGYKAHPLFYRACTNVANLGMGGGIGEPVSEDTASLARRFNYVQQKFSGSIRSLLWANALYAAVFNKVPIPKAIWQTYFAQSQDKGYNSLMANVMKGEGQTKAFKPGTNQLLRRDGKTTQSFDSLLIRHKNKLILLDFWASWCGPCRAEMPGSKRLQQQYAGKSIAFVDVSTDGVISDWQKAAQEEGLNTTNSYLLLNADQSPLVKQYHINAIPRYILVGKDGKIINADAPRPTDPKLRLMIDQNL
jgi:thiol-disulfide isomerase/thioredoxin